MKKLIASLALSAVLALGMSSSLASQVSQPTAAKKTVSFMFMVSANKGSIKPGKDGEYILSINTSDLNKVVVFSERPKHIVKIISGKELASVWKDGTNSFKTDPPNATLLANGMKQTVAVITGIKVKGNRALFQLKPAKGETLPKQNKELEDITLVVDGETLSPDVCDGLLVFEIVFLPLWFAAKCKLPWDQATTSKPINRN